MPRLARVSPVAGLHRRRLTFAEVLAQAVSAVAPSAAMVTTPAVVLAGSGVATLPALAASTALVLLVGACVAVFARRLAAVGGVYTYTARGLGPVAAGVGGWSLAIGYAAVAMSALVGCALYLAVLLALPGSAVAWLVLLVGGLAGWCTVRGIQLSARLALALEVVSIAVVVGVLVVLLVRSSGPDGSAAAVVDRHPGWDGVALAVVLGVLVAERLRREPEGEDPAREVRGTGAFPLPQLPVGDATALPPSRAVGAGDADDPRHALEAEEVSRA